MNRFKAAWKAFKNPVLIRVDTVYETMQDRQPPKGSMLPVVHAKGLRVGCEIGINGETLKIKNIYLEVNQVDKG